MTPAEPASPRASCNPSVVAHDTSTASTAAPAAWKAVSKSSVVQAETYLNKGSASIDFQPAAACPVAPASNSPETPLHIVQRSINRRPCFSPRGLPLLPPLARKVGSRLNCAIHAYVLATNRLHLLVTPLNPASPCSTHAIRRWSSLRAVHQPLLPPHRQPVGRPLQIQRRGGRNGSAACYRYIRLSPVRADAGGRPQPGTDGQAIAPADWVSPMPDRIPSISRRGKPPRTRTAAYRSLFPPATRRRSCRRYSPGATGHAVGNDRFAEAICAAGIRRNSGKARQASQGGLRIAPPATRTKEDFGFLRALEADEFGWRKLIESLAFSCWIS